MQNSLRILAGITLLSTVAAACAKKDTDEKEDSGKAMATAAPAHTFDKSAPVPPSTPIPEGSLQQVAMDSAKKDCNKCGQAGTDPNCDGVSRVREVRECKGYAIRPDLSSARTLTAADRANGIEDKWCVTVSFLGRVDARPWEDLTFGGVYTKRSGAWQLEQNIYLGKQVGVDC